MPLSGFGPGISDQLVDALVGRGREHLGGHRDRVAARDLGLELGRSADRRGDRGTEELGPSGQMVVCRGGNGTAVQFWESSTHRRGRARG